MKKRRRDKTAGPDLTNKWQRLFGNYIVWIALAIIILFVAAIRLRLLDIPLERDEGEYAYASQLILQGIPPYTQAYNMKMPGTYAAYAVILAIFGQTVTGIHLGALFINAATILLVYLLGRKLFDPIVGVVAAAVFGFVTLAASMSALSANSEHFVLLPAVAGIVLLLDAVKNRKLWLLSVSGLLLSLAFIMKQHGIAFVLFGGVYLLFCELGKRPFVPKTFVLRVSVFVAGLLLPFGITCLILYRAGAFEKFWFWTFQYAWKYVTMMPLSTGLTSLTNNLTSIIVSSIVIWILAGLGLIGLFVNKKTRHHGPFVVGFLFFSFLSTCPGLYFRGHYFILLMPAIAILAGIAISCLSNFFGFVRSGPKLKTAAILFASTILFYTGYTQRDYLFLADSHEAVRMVYGLNPFPESIQIAKYIKENSTKNDSIAVIGSEPQIYFYADRHAATGYIYTYALMEDHSYALQMQREMIREIEAAPPKFMVFVGISTSWMMNRKSEKLILQWFNDYSSKYYRQVGIIDILSDNLTNYQWGSKCEKLKASSNLRLLVFQRKAYNDIPLKR